ncbi:MAG: AMP-binding protein, partial [Anaerolineae bacterium]|nr:AMP-binding protein [Anaerolineae bacterium]
MSRNNTSSMYDGGSLPTLANTPQTLSEALRQTANKTAGQNNIIYIRADGSTQPSSYIALLTEAERILAGLRRHGLEPGTQVVLQLEANDNILPAFWGCILGGFIPLIAAVPLTYAMPSRALEQLVGLWRHLEQPLILTSEHVAETRDLPTLQQQLGLTSEGVAHIEDLRKNEPDQSHHTSQADDIAFFSTTSGSTGVPKCIVLSHRNLLNRAVGVNTVQASSEQNIVLNWLPFDHIGAISDHHLRFVTLGSTLIYAPKEYVLSRPLTWLDLLSQHQVTHSWAPNFFYSLVLNALDEGVETPVWDLSSVEVLLTAGEAVSAEVVEAFLTRLAPSGLKRTALCPAFGMAEMGSGVTYFQPTTARPFGFQTVQRSTAGDGDYGSLEPASPDDPDSITFTSLGPPIPGVSLRLVDEHNRPVSTGAVGRLQVKGEAVSKGYYNNQAATDRVFLADGWFDTEDLAFMVEGELYITGRVKESIIINGVNFYSSEIEQVATAVEGVEASYTAACAVRKVGSTTEQLALFFHPTNFTQATEAHLKTLIGQIRKAVSSQVGVTPTYVLPLDKAAIPKTSIGKIQRTKLSQQFEAGAFDELIHHFSRHPRPTSPNASGASRTAIEQQLVHIWQSSLELDQVSLHDNFFELGGDSVRLIQIHARLQEQFETDLTLVDLFEYSTIHALAGRLEQAPSPNQATPQRRRSPTSQADIAVIGLACRFPGADTPEKFWQNLRDGVESITTFSDEELLAAGVEPALLHNPDYVKANPTIPDIDRFDAKLFGYAPAEASLMDPQQRLMLECAWETLEAAGYNPFTYAGAIGMFAGAVWNTYQLNNLYPARHQLGSNGGMQIVTPDSLTGFQMMVANDKDYLTTKVSYKLNLTGPSVNVQTACSTSLVAIHIAGQSLRLGECDMALAGGISIQVPQTIGYLYQDGLMVSPDGHCRAFDANAQGTIFGSGVGLVLLKRLDDALADGDTVYAVVKGSAMNNDGGEKVGYFAPKGNSQAEVAAEALTMADFSAETISYVEAHGTGTILGDPIEVSGLSQAFRRTTDKQSYCAIGSVKTNIGHMQIASGIAGFIKTVLALHHKQLPPSLHFAAPNPQIDFANSPFYVNTTLQEWTTKDDLPRRAGVNSLGVGGTNVHVILEEAPPTAPVQPQPDAPSIIILSAQSEPQLQSYAKKLLDFVESQPTVALSDMAYTLQVGRVAMNTRLAMVVTDLSSLREKLSAYLSGEATESWGYQGEGERHNFFKDDDDARHLISLWLSKGKLEKLAEVWVDGVEIDWTLLYGQQKPKRVSLPTYPFARESYWLPNNEELRMNNEELSLHNPQFTIAALHPLVHKNISDLEEQRFSTVFRGSEFFLTDHRIRGEKILPGVAYLEMARAAGALALRGKAVTQIKDVVWLRPLVVGDAPVETQVGLYAEENEAIAFEISSRGEVHSQGKLVVGQAGALKPLDLGAIQARCHSMIESDDCYRRFEAQDLAYGPAFQVIEKLIYNEREALARLRLPTRLETAEYGLHPSMLDAALQATLC